jgi:hydroxylamine reductase (hybrid-cluster protein)
MELAYADAFGIPTFVILHHLTHADLLHSNEGVPPLLLSSQCNAASDWRQIVADLRRHIGGEETHNG